MSDNFLGLCRPDIVCPNMHNRSFEYILFIINHFREYQRQNAIILFHQSMQPYMSIQRHSNIPELSHHSSNIEVLFAIPSPTRAGLLQHRCMLRRYSHKRLWKWVFGFSFLLRLFSLFIVFFRFRDFHWT